MKKVVCQNIDCENEFELGNPKKPGYYKECWECGKESDKNTKRLGAVMHYEHKTAPTIVIMSLEDAKEIQRKTKRKNGSSIISGISEAR